MTLLFVYGTLKRGYSNHNRLLINASFMGEALSNGSKYVMRDVGFPIVWEDQSGAPLKGEVFDVNDETLQRCDLLEGHPKMYRREVRRFYTPKKEALAAWIYLWQGIRDHGSIVLPRNHGARKEQILEWGRPQ